MMEYINVIFKKHMNMLKAIIEYINIIFIKYINILSIKYWIFQKFISLIREITNFLSQSPPKPYLFVNLTLQSSMLPLGGFLGPKSPKDLRNFDHPKHGDFVPKPVDLPTKPVDLDAKSADIFPKEVIKNYLGKHNESLSNLNKDLYEKYRTLQKESLNEIEKIKTKYLNLSKSCLSEEKKEFIKQKYYLAKNSCQVKLDIFSSFKCIIINFKEYLFSFSMLQKFFNCLSFEHLMAIENIFGLSIVGTFAMRIIMNKPIFNKLDLLKVTAFMFYLTPILQFTSAQIYFWFLWFMFIISKYYLFDYHRQISEFIENVCGAKIRAFVKDNFYRTINPKYKLSSFPPLYKFKFQLICLKDKIMNKIVIDLNEIPSILDLIAKLEGELIFYITQRQLFVDIIWRLENGVENFYPDESVILFRQYIEVIDHLVEEMQGRVAELKLNLKKENTKGGLKEDKRTRDNWEDDGTDY